MMSSFFYFLVTLLLLIFVHEFGHFLVARCCGVQVLRFSFGFGKILYTWKDKQGTEFVWALLPLGGYVKFLDENETPVPVNQRHLALNRKPRWMRILIVLAGPFFNFLCAFFLLWLVAVIGIKSFAPRIESVKSNTPAAYAHIGNLQEIIAMNGKKINSWRDVHYVLMPLIGSTKDISITVKGLRNGEIKTHFLPLQRWKFDSKHSDLLESLGIVPLFPQLPVVIGTVQAQSPAQAAGLLPGDEILTLNHHPILDWSNLIQSIKGKPGAYIELKVQRQNQFKIFKIVLREQVDKHGGLLGISPKQPEIPADWLRLERSRPIEAFGYAWHQTLAFIETTLTLMGRTLVGKLPLQQLSGPVGIAKAAGESIDLGPVYYLFFVALLSISVGVLNLLPIPLLDGGHVLYECIEMLIGRPLSKDLKAKGIFLGMILIMLLTVVALYNDLTWLESELMIGSRKYFVQSKNWIIYFGTNNNTMRTIRKNLVLAVCCASTWFTPLYASQGFIVKDIKITGLKRVSEGTVLNYLPVQVGEEVNADSTPKIIRALYETGFFQSVVLEREGSILIVQVIERSTIGSITVTGNTEIPADKMKELLKEIGLVKGQVFQRSSLELLKKNLKQAYNARGKYNARINSRVVPLTENRVAITITISEGRVSRIKSIKIIGNQDFKTYELTNQLSLSSSNILTYVTKKDQYSKAAMDASLESLRSFYLNHGYLKFRITSSQVVLAPDRTDVFINIYIKEGPQYRFSGYDIEGKTIIAKEKLQKLIPIKKGTVFSRQEVTQAVTAINTALGDIGYGFPVVNAEPVIDEIRKTVFVRFIIDPGRHVYVRRINFHGNTKTSDDLLRNVIRQTEGSLLSLHNIKESERQLRLLSYLKDIDIKTTPIPGANNQVDLDVQVAEASSAEASASVGYGTTGPQINASINQYNFMGTGRTIGLGFNASWWGQNYSFNYFNPFYTKTGIGRGVNAYFEKVDPRHLEVSMYNSDRFGGDVNYSVRLSDASSFQFGYGYQGLDIQSVGGVQSIQNFVNLHGTQFNQIRLAGGWSRNTYDRMPFPTKGSNQQAVMWFALPASSNSLNYYKGNYQAHWYQPLYKELLLTLLGSVGYGNTYNHDGLPFYENFFAGGIAQPGQVRGYESYSLGPIDNFGNAIGANLLINGSAGIVLPYPFSRETIRSTLFIDAGNVFAEGIPTNLTGSNEGPLRFSGGISLEWRSPLGPLAFSLASPINQQQRDRAQYFQFSASTGF